MARKSKQPLSAEVAIRSASGKSFDSQTAITSENVASYLPSAEVVEEARRAFEDLGFEVSKPGGVGFSITASASVFEKAFKVKIISDERGVRAAAGGDESYELPLKALPKKLAQDVVAVTFSPPPDYGPGSF